ncbi:hypothetical protein PB1_08567 [Bacillus methanolicus PB1]|uniref:Uncharacterized protein n=1 Tax=Bacillus methanolicus PB1 TaxID=997296 RepID=I3E1M8_BACMT|nr:hypothetical protein [Bacillus methanolicus]EIJ80399.1 hypothetical protein PB1_08567 [Bacillus methanolicus PB1]
MSFSDFLVKKTDHLMGRDPDARRGENLEGQYVVLSGNQTGALMAFYHKSKRKG